MKKNKIILLVCFMIANLQTKAQSLLLNHSDGSTTEITLNRHPIVKFTDDKIEIHSTLFNMQFDATNVLGFSFSNVNTSIDKILFINIYIENNKESIIFHNIGNPDNYEVYDINGIKIKTNVIYSNNSLLIPLSSLPSGMYIINIDGKTHKIMKQ